MQRGLSDSALLGLLEQVASVGDLGISKIPKHFSTIWPVMGATSASSLMRTSGGSDFTGDLGTTIALLFVGLSLPRNVPGHLQLQCRSMLASGAIYVESAAKIKKAAYDIGMASNVARLDSLHRPVH
jgi:hypothetical protein